MSADVCWLNEDCIAGYHMDEIKCRFPTWTDDALEIADVKNQRDMLALAMWDVRKSFGFDTDGDDRYHTQDFGFIAESFRRDMAEIHAEWEMEK